MRCCTNIRPTRPLGCFCSLAIWPCSSCVVDSALLTYTCIYNNVVKYNRSSVGSSALFAGLLLLVVHRSLFLLVSYLYISGLAVFGSNFSSLSPFSLALLHEDWSIYRNDYFLLVYRQKMGFLYVRKSEFRFRQCASRTPYFWHAGKAISACRRLFFFICYFHD